MSTSVTILNYLTSLASQPEKHWGLGWGEEALIAQGMIERLPQHPWIRLTDKGNQYVERLSRVPFSEEQALT